MTNRRLLGSILLISGGEVKLFSLGGITLKELCPLCCIVWIQCHQKSLGNRMQLMSLFHVIVSQALPEEHEAILLTTVSQSASGSLESQAAVIAHRFSGIRDLTDRLSLSNIAPDSIIVRRGRLIFPSDLTVRVGSGDGIVLNMSPPMPSHDQQADEHLALSTPDVGIGVEPDGQGDMAWSDEANQDQSDHDDVLLMQRLVDLVADKEPRQTTPLGEDARSCAIELDAAGQRENDFFQFNPNAEVFRPQAYVLPEWAQVIEDIYHVWDGSAFAWQGESRATHFMTWFVAPGIGRLQCRYGRRIALFADFWNWREQFRRKWIDELDARVDFDVVLVSPPPTQIESGIAGHIILIQHNDPVWSSVLLSTFDPAINNGHPFHMAQTFTEQLHFQDILVRVGYVDECTFHAQCLFRLRSQMFAPTDRIRASDGDAVDLLVNRHFLPANWNPPFIPHAPGAEGLALLQKRVTVERTTGKSNIPIQRHASTGPVTPLLIQSCLSNQECDVQDVPFTLSVFMNQKHVQEAKIMFCTWELHDGCNQFDIHKYDEFDNAVVCLNFQKQHNLIRKCSALYPVRFTRSSWNIESKQWYIGSFVHETAEQAIVACVVYRQGCASAKAITLPSRCRVGLLRDRLSIIHGTFLRLNGTVVSDTIGLVSGDVFEYHEADISHSFCMSRNCPKVQICLDAAISVHTPAFEDDGDAFMRSFRILRSGMP